MKLNKIKLLVVIIVLLVPSHIKAECSLSEISDYKNKAKYVDFSLSILEFPNEEDYTLSDGTSANKMYILNSIYNLEEGLVVRDNNMNRYYTSNVNLSIGPDKMGITKSFDIYVNTENCQMQYLMTKNIKYIDKYNTFTDSEECIGNHEYDVCKYDYKGTESDEQKKIKLDFIKNKNIIKKEEVVDTNHTLFNLFLKIYQPIAITCVIFGTIGIIYLQLKKDRL